MRNKLKKVLSLMMVALLLITSVPAMTFAEPQVFPQQYGESLDITSAQGSPVVIPTVAQGEIWAGKDVTYKGNGEFDISLLAGGRNYIVQTPKPQEQYDVVLILDRSGSMGGDKLASMKTAAIGAATAFLKVPGNTISIISYNQSPNTNLSYSTSLENVTNTINGLKVDKNRGEYTGGTNIQAAFFNAENLLKSRTQDAAKKKSVVILLSDGEPTYYHTSLTSHTDGNKEGDGNKATELGVAYTILQGQQLKDSIEGLNIYTIGFSVSGALAEATLQPTSSNAGDIISENFQSVYSKSATETAKYKYYWAMGWTLNNPITTKDATVIYGPSTFLGVLSSVPSNVWNSPTTTGDIIDKGWEGALRIGYKTGTRTGTVYEGTPLEFKHQYWSEGSSFVSSDINALIKVFTDIVNEITNVPPHELVEVDQLSDVVITDVVGSNFDIVNPSTLDGRADVVVNGNTVTWTISGENLYTLLADETVLNPSLLNTLTFTVKAKEAAGINMPTNTLASASFTVDSAKNKHYTSDNQTLNILTTGLITIAQAKGSIIENHIFTDASDKNTSTSHIGNVGTTKSFSPVAHDGYTYEITVGQASMNFARTEQTVTFTYTPIPRYTLDVEIIGSGTVNKTPDQADYLKDAAVALEAIPAAGFIFAGWSKDASGVNPNTSVTMDDNKEVTATFTPVYTLTVNVIGNGTVTQDPVKVYYNPGEVVSLTAIAGDEETMFLDWSGDIMSFSANESIIMDGDKVITATFAPIPPDIFTLTVTTEGSGTVTPSGGDFVEGSSVSVVATPAPGWAFTGWSGDLTGDNTEETVLMDDHKAIHAIFTEIPVYHTLSTHVVGSGSINVAPESEAYLKGSSVSFEAVPAPGWMFSGWSGDASGNSISGSLNMTKDMDITATFTQIPSYTLTVNHELSTGGEFAAPEVTTDFKEGESYTTSAKPVDPSEYTVSTPENASGTFGNTNITVTYVYTPVVPEEPVTYTLTVNHVLSAGGNYSTPVVTPGFKVEDSYSTSPAAFDPTLYTVNAPENASGFFGSANITVTYIYTPVVPVVTEPPTTQPPSTQPPSTEAPVVNPPVEVPQGPQGIVRVEFVDAQGNTIADPFQFSGGLGTNYITSPKSVDGYVVSESPANASGIFTEATIVVTYVYSDGTEVIDEEEVAQGEATTEVATEQETTEAVEIELEETPLADALPQTGQLPAELFYGAGSLITAIGVYLKKRK